MKRIGISRCEMIAIRFTEKNLLPILAVAALIIGILIRIPLFDFVSMDYYYFLGPWYEQIAADGISEQVGNYNLVYQLLILLLSRLPIPPLYAYKLLSCLFDLVLALSAGYLVLLLSGGKREGALLTATLVLLSPPVILNSALWAQCDSIFISFVLLSLIALVRERYIAFPILFGIALAFKLQAIFFLPALLLIWFIRRRFSLLCFLIAPVAMLIAGLPAVLFGRNPLDTFAIYAEQTTTYPYMAMNYPSFWQLVVNVNDPTQYELFHLPAMLFCAAVLILLAALWLYRRLPADSTGVLTLAFLLSYAAILFLPAMHERYSYGYEVLAICLAFLKPRTVPLAIALQLIALCSYAPYLFGVTPVAFPLLAALNIAIFFSYTYLIFRSKAEGCHRTKEANL